ncbi:hypothetical protein RHSIM_Rhsim13G0024100 [Rhododendron simsii]|uniref:Uncharacterized protein n=1 Tax=Rhododendron simsii TaxID=118357 RepID=A0A834FYC0_RHOSS|nr:hypothetical protein RHSIM_Rhsim13G0024100 [Rhododendron simsii]
MDTWDMSFDFYGKRDLQLAKFAKKDLGDPIKKVVRGGDRPAAYVDGSTAKYAAAKHVTDGGAISAMDL